MLAEFFVGVRTLARGFGVWRTRPALMALGLVPALITLALLAAALVPLFFSLGAVTAWATPFAEGWATGWQVTLRSALGIVVVLAALALSALIFPALTLIIGDPFYQRIWRAVEADLGGDVPAGDGSWWTSVTESISLLLWGMLIAVCVLLVGLIPLIGAPVAAVGGLISTGFVLARDLTARAFNAREFTPEYRAALFGAARARTIGFGVATQLCFAIPLGAVIVVPAAVAGSTFLARDLRNRLETPGAHQPEAYEGRTDARGRH
ncbi:EI24 domain-containing protein [Microbacterium sp. YY-01]|uniref:EI24 domain-containing protein n=1 Tax=Microbacterium sp. YY-01 TaxID=3421634 RepID=UPI003D163D23